ncbi:MAG: sugar kinase [Alphaproteobacteria bacterium]|nr:sugar kinase [Alphaproteobacteria bacterium]
MTSVDLVAIGEPLVEFNQAKGTDSYLRGHGGDTSNAAIAAARQGARVGYFTALGADPFGESFMQLWAREGVDASAVIRTDQAPTAIYFVTHTERGHEFTYFRAGSAASRLGPADVPAAYLSRAKIVHASGISLAISASACDLVFAAFAHARASGAKVSFDTNLRLKLWPLDRARAVMHAIAAQADYLFPSIDEAAQLTGLDDADAVVDFYLRLGAKAVALKLGPAGALVATADARHRVAGLKVDAVDATGAGDTFVGSFLARVLAGDGLADAARYANAAAALSTTGYGAVAPIPRVDQVRAVLR